MMAFLLTIGLVGISFSGYRVIVREKRRKSWTGMDEFIMASGAGGLSLVELYMASENHSDALDQLHRVMSTVIPEGASGLDWLKEFEKIKASGDSATTGLISLWKGSLAEDRAVDALNHDPHLMKAGIHAERFASPNHPDTDIHFVHSDGSPLTPQELDKYHLDDLQVKSYAAENYGNFTEMAKAQPHITYVVNHEMYEQLQDHHFIQSTGIHVIDGGWSDLELHNEAVDVMNQIESSSDITHNIPFIGLAIFGKRTWDNVQKFRESQRSGQETFEHAIGDAGRMGMVMAGAATGAKIGAVIGTALFPGVGTIALSVVFGIIGGGFFRNLANWFKEKFIYEKIMRACESVGINYWDSYFNPLSFENAAINNRLFNQKLSLEKLNGEHKLAEQKGLRKNMKDEPTVTNALLARGLAISERVKLVSQRASEIYREKFKALFLSVREGVDLKKRHGLLGSFVSKNQELLLAGASGYETFLKEFDLEAKKKWDHPYRLRDSENNAIDEKEVLKSLVVYSFDEAEKQIGMPELFWNKASFLPLMILIISIIVIAWSLTHW